MTWSIEFLEEAKKDMKKLDHSAQIQVLKGITKVSGNPLPAEEGGYGKPLGNKSGTNLTNLMKIKFRDLGIRVVYKIEIAMTTDFVVSSAVNTLIIIARWLEIIVIPLFMAYQTNRLLGLALECGLYDL